MCETREEVINGKTHVYCDSDCGKCGYYQCKCADCFFLVEDVDGTWLCDEHEKPCAEVELCNNWDSEVYRVYEEAWDEL